MGAASVPDGLAKLAVARKTVMGTSPVSSTDGNATTVSIVVSGVDTPSDVVW
jgi:hypothetical protein